MEPDNDKMDADKIMISIKDLYKSFGENEVLCGVNLEVHNKENVVVLGRSGTGKSVLIKIVCGLLKPDSGEVNVLGKEVEPLNDKELQQLRLEIGFSFQNSALYDSMTVRENLAFPLVRHAKHLSKKEVQEQIERVLNDVGLLQTINQMPSELSGGQRKRIGIAQNIDFKAKNYVV